MSYIKGNHYGKRKNGGGSHLQPTFAKYDQKKKKKKKRKKRRHVSHNEIIDRS